MMASDMRGRLRPCNSERFGNLVTGIAIEWFREGGDKVLDVGASAGLFLEVLSVQRRLDFRTMCKNFV